MDVDDSGESALLNLAGIAGELGCEHLALSTRSIAERVSEGLFYVACVGQFKRGKSTLLNALVGHPLLPVGVTPVTSVPTILRYGNALTARLRLPEGKFQEIPVGEIGQYVSEEENPENVKQIAAVEVFAPSTFLASGICLVDTPGVGSVFAGNTKSTHEFIPHMDAVLVVIGADPPLSGDELVLIETVAREVNEIIFVLNKADRASESDRDAALKFARRTLETRLHRSVPAIYEISALERLEHRGPKRDWEKLSQALGTLAGQSGHVLIRAAAQRGMLRAANQLIAVIDENRRALQRPLQESERRIVELRATLERAGQAMQDLGALLMAEQERLSRTFAERRKTFLTQAGDVARNELCERLPSISRAHNGPAYRREAMHLAQEIACAHLAPWFENEERFAEVSFRATAERFAQLGNDFLRRFAESGIAELDNSSQPLDSDTMPLGTPKFQFHMIERVAAPASPLLFFADLVRFALGSRGGIERDAGRFLEVLLEVNSARVQSAVEERVREGRRKLESVIQALLHDVGRTAEHALSRAREAQTSGAAAVQARLAWLNEIEERIDKVRISSMDSDGLLKKVSDLPHTP
jgi:GTP-binding protein EngB required for normal cell division